MASLPENVTGLTGAQHRTHHETIHARFNQDELGGASRGLPTPNTCGYMAWGAAVVPDATFGYAGVPGSVNMADIRAVGTIRRTLVYKSFLEVPSFAGAVGTDPEADTTSDATAGVLRHQFWNNTFASAVYMKEAAADIVDGFGCRILDLSDKDAQRYSFQAARATAHRIGMDAFDSGFFADTWSDDLVGTGGILTEPDGVATANDWENRYVLPFSAAVFAGLRAAGVYVAINGSGTKSGYHSEGSVDRGDSRLRWMATMAPYVDAFCHEYAFEGSDSDPLDDSIGVTGVAANGYRSWWRYQLRVPALAGALGKGYFGIVTSGNTLVSGANALNSATINVVSTAGFPSSGSVVINGVTTVTYGGKGPTTLTGCSSHPAYSGGEGVVSTDGQALRFSRGSLLLVWNGLTEAAIYDFRGLGLTDTSPSWRWETGYPIASHRMTGRDSYTRSRQFQLGTLVVNPDPSTAHTAGDAGTTSVPARDTKFFTGEWF